MKYRKNTQSLNFNSCSQILRTVAISYLKGPNRTKSWPLRRQREKQCAGFCILVVDHVILIWRWYLPGVEPGISRSLVGITTGTPWRFTSSIKLDVSLHGVPVVIPTNDREIPGSTPGRYNLQIQGGPEPLENEINKILGSKREDRFRTIFPVWYKISFRFVFRTGFASAFSVRPRGTCESSRRSARR